MATPEQTSSTKPFYITTPLYYVNAPPHIGSAYTTMAADAIARYWRLKGRTCYLLTGVDEHGGKIQAIAEAAGLAPQEHCNRITASFESLWNKLNIDHQKFCRTTTNTHIKAVSEFFRRAKLNGDIYEAEYGGLYCLGCEDFKNERELLNEQLCPIHKAPVQKYAEKNHFFALSKYTEQIRKLIDSNPDFIRPHHRAAEVRAWLDEGLKDFPISRRSVQWGVPVPGDPQQTIYVWFDALIGYISPWLNEEAPNLDDLTSPDSIWPPDLHLIGKDILRFHAVYWPAMLISAGLPLPKSLFGHGFLTKDGEKMGKSTGNIVDPIELIDKYGVDAVRFYFLFAVSFGCDGDFSDKNFLELCNAYLANRLGNLFSRILKLLETHCSSSVPSNLEPLRKSELASKTASLAEAFSEHMINLELSIALQKVFDHVDGLNLKLTEAKPWSTLKDGSSQERQAAITLLLACLASLRTVANLLWPFMPNLSAKMLTVYGLDKPLNWETMLNWENIFQAGQTIHNPGAMFNRLL